MHTRATLLLSLDGPAAEQKAETTNPDNYKPVGDQAEIQSPERLVVMAYAIIWIILFGVVILAYLRTRSLASRLEVIEAALAKRGGSPEPAPKQKSAKPATGSEPAGSEG